MADSGTNSVTVDVTTLPSVPGTETAAMIPAEGEPATAANALLAAQEGAGKGPLINKGSVSNAITFVIMAVFIVIKTMQAEGEVKNPAVEYGLAFGLFGFAGGVTNWLAVTMLFDKIPLLIGSGVIPRHFISIRAAVKKVRFLLQNDGFSAQNHGFYTKN